MTLTSIGWLANTTTKLRSTTIIIITASAKQQYFRLLVEEGGEGRESDLRSITGVFTLQTHFQAVHPGDSGGLLGTGTA
jgi:hypothetical protein